MVFCTVIGWTSSLGNCLLHCWLEATSSPFSPSILEDFYNSNYRHIVNEIKYISPAECSHRMALQSTTEFNSYPFFLQILVSVCLCLCLTPCICHCICLSYLYYDFHDIFQICDIARHTRYSLLSKGF